MMFNVVAGTGHRPFQGKLLPLQQERDNYPQLMTNLIELALIWLEKEKPDEVISGMALGWDQALAQAAIYKRIPFTAAIPFLGQESRWTLESKKKYKEILHQADNVVCVSEGSYSPLKMQIRNEWMVDHATMILALWDGSQGGTGNCIRYAQEQKKPITNLWSKWKEKLK